MMVKLLINNQDVEVNENTSILEAAAGIGIEIPTLCWIKDFKPSVSCMLCVVEDKFSSRFIPACSTNVQQGMKIETNNEAVISMRKTALDLLLSEHSGDCNAPCQRTCPAGIDIPQMNRFIAAGNFEKAIQKTYETIPFPAILGHICSAPCEKACRRKDIDYKVSICLLKKYIGELNIKNNIFYPQVSTNKNKKVAIVGSGIMGLTITFFLQKAGYNCFLFDSKKVAGGEIRHNISENQLPSSILDSEIEMVFKLGAKFSGEILVNKSYFETVLLENYDCIIFATGKTRVDFVEFDIPEKKQDILYQFYREKHLFSYNLNTKESRMAVKSVALGRMISEKAIKTMEKEINSVEIKPFFSKYNRISAADKPAFLKETTQTEEQIKSVDSNTALTSDLIKTEAKRCLHCDCRKLNGCKLRYYASVFNAKQNIYELPEAIKVEKTIYLPNFVFESNKCIKCGICIQIAKKNKVSKGFTFIGRGFDVKIGIPLEQNNFEYLTKIATECIEHCPTGALADFSR